jgi:SAM-dependent methyltransferase
MSEPLYDRIGSGYASYRRADPRIAAHIDAALGHTRTVLNVGAGAGSYEPGGRSVVAVEPSAEMVRQRGPDAAPAVRASADRLPFRDGSFETVLAILSIHHWPDWRQGLREMLRVAADRVVLFTWDPDTAGFWLVRDYFPEMLAIDKRNFPQLRSLEALLGSMEAHPVLIPADCSDGFSGAYWRRPQAYLDADVRRAISTFAKLPDPEPALARLRTDLASKAWDRRNTSLLALAELDLGYRLIIARK